MGVRYCAWVTAVLVAISAHRAMGRDGDARPRWYRGNTHVHTVLCGHADSSPAAVAAWYLDRGYHFLCLSEHNRFIDTATVALPKRSQNEFAGWSNESAAAS